MGPDLGAVSVLQRCNDAPPVGVVLGVGAGHQIDVEGQTHPISLYLDVSLLHQVEQAHLNTLRQVRQLVDAEQPAVGSGNEAVVNGQLVGEISAFCYLDGVYFADEVCHSNIWGCQLLGIAHVPWKPIYLRSVPSLGGPLAAGLAQRVVRVIVYLASLDYRDLLVHECCQAADHTAFRLSALPEEDIVLARQDCVLDLGDDRVVEADNAGEKGFTALQLGDQVFS